jgi:type I restriction enzyme S subunit
VSWAYQEYSLDELGYLGRGKSKHRPRNDPALFGGDYPFVQTGDVKAANLHLTKFSETYNDFGLTQSKVWQKGTLLITIAANIAETSILGMDACFPDSVVGFIADEKKVNAYFVKYYIDFIKQQMQQISQGTTQDNLSLDKLRSFKFRVPEKRIVDEITHQIVSYDNLIENNNRRIAILEDMAQSLYREWFVKFRFPGHENCQFKDSPLGRIPEGWEVKSAADVIDINPRTNLPKDGVKPFVPMTCLSGSSMIIGGIEERVGNSGTKFINRDTLFARITPCLQNGKIGYVQFLTEENRIGFGSTEFIVLRENLLSAEYIYCLARSNNFCSHAINSMAGADGRQRVKSECFSSYYFAVPPQNLLDEFSGIARSCFSEIHNLNKKNINIKEQREMLLPKLISGAFSSNI